MRRWLPWIAFALTLLIAPMLWRSELGVSLLAQIGIAIIACLAYNILLGQGGMLSFGHAMYSGVAAFAALHVLGSWPVPVSLLPLVGGLAGLAAAAVFGFITTRRAGTALAMITLGLGELVSAGAPMWPAFFGGEAGISGNRVVGAPVLGISFGPQIQVYYLAALYCFVCTAAMYAFTRTPLGRMLNAVRDNPERAEFIGYSARRVRYLSFLISGFFAGVAGGLSALNFEIATGEALGAARSGALLLFVYLGGAADFFGPIIGAVMMVLSQVLLSELTKAWLLYLGLAFMLMVIYAPHGVAGALMALWRVARAGRLMQVLPALTLVGMAVLPLLAGSTALVEMVYQRQLDDASGTALRHLGVALDTGQASSWLGALALAMAGGWLLSLARKRFARAWHEAARS